MSNTKNKRPDVRRITIVGILSALTIALSLIPQIGYIIIPGLPVQITTVHIPVIIAGIIEGPFVGAFVGLIFGLSSLYQAVVTPTPIAFAFLNPLVSVLPRIFIGVVAWYVYKGANFLLKKKLQPVAIGISATLATLANTIGVLGMIYVLYAAKFLESLGVTGVTPLAFILTLALTNAPAEILSAIVLGTPIVMALKRMKRES